MSTFFTYRHITKNWYRFPTVILHFSMGHISMRSIGERSGAPWSKALRENFVSSYMAKERQCVVTCRYRILPEKEKTRPILRRPALRHVMFLQKYEEK